MDYSILLTTDGKGVEAKREALNHLQARVAELEAALEKVPAQLIKLIRCQDALRDLVPCECEFDSSSRQATSRCARCIVLNS